MGLACWVLLWTASLAAAPWEPFTTLAVSPDGQWLATGGLYGEVLWRESKTAEVRLATHLPGPMAVVGLSFSADSTTLRAALANGKAFVVRLPSPEASPVSPVPVVLAESLSRWRQGPTMSGVSVAWANSRATGGPDGRIRLTVGSQETAWKAHDAAVTGLAPGPDGTVLYSCSYDGGLAVWSLPSGKLLARL